MVDVVFNHVGYVPNGDDYSKIVPFNSAKYYHEQCDITDKDWFTNNQESIEMCRLFGLPDLNTESEIVKDILFRWIRDDVLVKYGFDGLRVDTVRHVGKRFWRELAVTLDSLDTFTMGEVSNSDSSYIASYQG